MGINKDLNVDPYYDDFDEAKQFNRVLFKPARAVQARELTQLQTILQKQVERFGSNVYKEGTIISGINLTSRDDLNYVKLQDQPGFTDPSLYNEFATATSGEKSRYILVGSDSGLKAEIVKGLNGFETQAPNLKTFFINYIGFSDNASTSQITAGAKQFGKGETLRVYNPTGESSPVLVDGVELVLTTQNPPAQSSDHVGKCFAVSCEEGVVYQKGHFIFVDEQIVIVTRYSDIPGQDPTNSAIVNNVSVGFSVKENIIDSNQDSSLLDNASGFNNQNAPGADRLQLVPTLVTYATDSEPENFFALIRYVGGNPIRIREFTEYNAISDENARRRYDESGNYVVSGLNSKLVKDANGTPNVEVMPGKAYVYGREVTNRNKIQLPLSPTVSSQTKPNQSTGVNYGQYFTFNATNAQPIHPLESPNSVDSANDGTETDISRDYDLYNGSTKIGSCNIANITAGRIYVFNVRKLAGQESAVPTAIADSLPGSYVGNKLSLTNSGKLFDQTKSAMLFDIGAESIKSVSNTVITRRVRKSGVSLADDGQGNNVDAVINADAGVSQPIANDNVFGIATPSGEQTPRIYRPILVSASKDVSGVFTGMTVRFPAGTPTSIIVYYDQTTIGETHDDLVLVSGFVKTQYDSAFRGATLGNSNVVSIEKILVSSDGTNNPDSLTDVTSKFFLVNNQTDTMYDTSYIELRSGETAPSANNLIVELKCLKLDNIDSSGYLTANSYPESAKQYLRNYTTDDGVSHDLLTLYDFRKYKQSVKEPASDFSLISSYMALADADSLLVREKFPGAGSHTGMLAVNSVINSTIEHYLSRVDSVVLNEYGDTLLISGDESDKPAPLELNNLYKIADVLIPGNSTSVRGKNAIRILNTSNRVYTMKDIEDLDKRLTALTTYVKSTSAEDRANNIVIANDTGHRFKNAILTDNFNDFKGSDILDPLYRSAIGGDGVLMPAVNRYNINLKADRSTLSNVSTTATSDAFTEVITLAPNAQTVPVVSQPYATDTRNTVTNTYKYDGEADMYPRFSSDVDYLNNPYADSTVDLSIPYQAQMEYIQTFVEPNAANYNKVAANKLISDLQSRVFKTKETAFVEVDERDVGADPHESVLAYFPYGSTSDLFGKKISTHIFIPFVAPQGIKIFATGLRPNARHYVYFDKKAENLINIKQGLENTNSAYRNGVKADKRWNAHDQVMLDQNTEVSLTPGAAYELFTDKYGVLRATALIPGKTVIADGFNFLEIADVATYDDIKDFSSSYAKVAFRGNNFDGRELSYSTRPLEGANSFSKEVTHDGSTFTTFISGMESAEPDRTFGSSGSDPIAQTFKIKSASTGNSRFAYINDIDVYFRTVSSNFGVTLQIREVIDGYPSKNILPFASKTLSQFDPLLVSSVNGTQATKFKFDNPVKLRTDTEYAFTIKPNANAPQYVLFTSKVGNPSLSKLNTAVVESSVSDWGDGKLFVSTNDSSWKPNVDEDLKFVINRCDFSTTNGTVDLIPDDVEFLTIRDNARATGTSDIIHFENDELVYVTNPANTVYPMTIGGGLDDNNAPTILTPGAGTIALNEGDYVLVQASDSTVSDKVVARIVSGQSDGGTFTLDSPYPPITAEGGVSVQVSLVVAGIVSHYSSADPSKLHLKQSSAKAGNFIDNNASQNFNQIATGTTYTIVTLGDSAGHTAAWQDVGAGSNPQQGDVFVAGTLPANPQNYNGTVRPNTQIIRSVRTGAEAKITSTDTFKLSYFEPKVAIDNTINTGSKLELFEKNDSENYVIDKPISSGEYVYGFGGMRSIISKSEQLRSGGTFKEDFRIRATLSNKGMSSVSPVLDTELTGMCAVQVDITNDSNGNTTSNWISREVMLENALPAVGLSVFIDAFRPAGTMIDVYARFRRNSNPDSKTNFVDNKLILANPEEYSNLSNPNDYRHYEYSLNEGATPPEYTSFQLRFVLRHSTSDELDSPDLNSITPDINLFPIIDRFDAVAVT
jgi:hypothetical protein